MNKMIYVYETCSSMEPVKKLSPLYDVYPVPYGDELALNVTENDNHISLNVVLELAEMLDISKFTALKEIHVILSIVKTYWTRLALEYGLSRTSIEYMRPAFHLAYESYA